MSGNTNSDILIAGAIAAFTVDLLVYPLDTIKTRIQSPDYARLYTHAGTGKPNAALFRGVYQGIGSVIVATLPSSGAFFSTYEQTKTLFTGLNTTSSRPDGVLPLAVVHAGASALAELVSCAMLAPAEVVKQNAQMAKAGDAASTATLRTLHTFKHAPLALWRGYAALALRNLPFTALHFPLFEALKAAIGKARDARNLTTGSMCESACITAVSAGSAGALAAVLTTPVDVVKTRVMLAAGEHAAQSLGKLKPSKRQSSLSIGRDIVREKGIKGLWRGGALRGVWTFIGAGLYLGAYESGRVYLASRRGESVDEGELF